MAFIEHMIWSGKKNLEWPKLWSTVRKMSQFYKYIHIACAVYTPMLKIAGFAFRSKDSQMPALHRCDLFSRDARRKGTLAVTHRHVSSSSLMCPREIAPHVTDAGSPVTRENHVNTPHAHSLALCTHLTWNKVDNTMLSKPVPETEVSLWAARLNTLTRQADTAASGGRGVGVTARYHYFIPPLPGQPLTVMLTETDAQTLHASEHGQAYTHTNINLCGTDTKQIKKDTGLS